MFEVCRKGYREDSGADRSAPNWRVLYPRQPEKAKLSPRQGLCRRAGGAVAERYQDDIEASSAIALGQAVQPALQRIAATLSSTSAR